MNADIHSTRERILYESLKLFSEKGYDGVSMREIARAVEIKAASLYAHFSGKEAIYQAIIETMKNRYREEAHHLAMDGSDPAADVAVYKHISAERLFSLGKELFLFFLHDEYIRLYRKMLTIGQFQSSEIAKEYSRQYYDESIAYQTRLFELLAKAGEFRTADCEVMALQFYAPIYTFITVCDRQPEREAEMLELLQKHMVQFAAAYRKQDCCDAGSTVHVLAD